MTAHGGTSGQRAVRTANAAFCLLQIARPCALCLHPAPLTCDLWRARAQEDEGGGSGQPAVRARHGPPPVVTQLASVRELLEEAEEGPGGAQAHDGGLGFGGGGAAGGAGGADSLAALLREHTFVGMVRVGCTFVELCGCSAGG